MTSAAFPLRFALFGRASSSHPRSQSRTDPPTPVRKSPVFIHDAVTPWRGETWLSARLKEDLARLNQDPD